MEIKVDRLVCIISYYWTSQTNRNQPKIQNIDIQIFSPATVYILGWQSNRIQPKILTFKYFHQPLYMYWVGNPIEFNPKSKIFTFKYFHQPLYIYWIANPIEFNPKSKILTFKYFHQPLYMYWVGNPIEFNPKSKI